MSTAADHTVLTAITTTPVFGDILLEEYARDRRIMVVPTTAVMLAARLTNGSQRLAALRSSHPAVIKWVSVDDAAFSIGTHIPRRNGAGQDWTADAPVVWAAQRHGLPILTSEPDRYRTYGVPLVVMP
ncbi:MULTISPECIES: hypothetical protein [unclassified Nocardia]|uniref:hypothetical protein n=1 Tax=unclassified Nocardia TaxID=2637762 RepID=UPI001CE4A35D|nr:MULTISPECIES: hypothetical protein [unclassified Nocardia]